MRAKYSDNEFYFIFFESNIFLGENEQITNGLLDIANQLVKTINWTVPPEGWKKAIELEKRTVYTRRMDFLAHDDNDTRDVAFYLEDRHVPSRESRYHWYSDDRI